MSSMAVSRFLITGGSQGIGAAIVELACKAGHQVVFTGRNQQQIDAVARQPARTDSVPTSHRATTTPGRSTSAPSAWAASMSSSTTPATPTAARSARSTSAKMKEMFDTNVFGLVDFTNWSCRR